MKKLIYTEDPENCRNLLKDDLPAVLILTEQNQNQNLWGIPYIVSSPEDLTRAESEEIYCRLKGLPLELKKTGRCIIREESPEDVGEIYEIWKDEQCRLFLDPLPENPAEYLCRLKDYIRSAYCFNSLGLWVITDQESGRVIGKAGFTPEKDILWLGYVISPSFRRKGYASEVLAALLELFEERFKYENFRHVRCRVSPENKPSLSLLKKLGFKQISSDAGQLILEF